MAMYQVSFEIEAPSFAEAMTLAEDRVLQPKDDRSYLSVSPIRVPTTGSTTVDRARMTWSVNVPGSARYADRAGVWLSFDCDREEMSVVIASDAAEPTTTTIRLGPEHAAVVVRAMRTWPLDLIDAMAASRARRGGS